MFCRTGAHDGTAIHFVVAGDWRSWSPPFRFTRLVKSDFSAGATANDTSAIDAIDALRGTARDAPFVEPVTTT